MSAVGPGPAFELDDFQRQAIAGLGRGSSVVVAAPTGAGKTVVAEHAIELALSQDQRVFYTTPIKALSNQKYNDLVATHSEAEIGLLTGDNAINADAPVVVMTTEVLRNMIYAGSQSLSDLRYVVLDEVHFLQDTYRGPVWEEVIIHLPPWVRLVCLSATVSNAGELADWVGAVRGATELVVETTRPVTLDHLYLAGDTSADSLQLVPLLLGGRPNPHGERFDSQRGPQPPGKRRRRFFTPSRHEVADVLAERELLPALFFIFSRAACDDAVRSCVNDGVRFTTDVERARIRTIIDEHLAGLASDDLDLLDADRWAHALECGVAAHHAGLVPPFKETVEACFVEGLVKLVFATETLALGINMPARCVVIEKLTKFTGERHEFLTPGQYTQLTGRAGRRGIDDHGTAIVLWSPWVSFADTAALAGSTEFHLRSAFRPTYNMAANLVRRVSPEEARRLLNLSFAQFQADGAVVRLQARLSRREEGLAELEAAAHCEHGDVLAYLDAREAIETERRHQREAEHAALDRALRQLRPGHVIDLPDHRGGRVAVVLSISERRGTSVRIRFVTSNSRVHNLGAADFDQPPAVLATIELPTPYTPHAPAFQRRVAELLSNVRVRAPHAAEGHGSHGGGSGGEGSADLARDFAGVASCPDLARHVRAAKRARSAARELAAMRRQMAAHTDSLAERFEAVLRLLEAWDHLEGWSLTERGLTLAGIFHECDLLVAEAVAEEVFDGLTPAELAGVASSLTYEHRSPLPPDPPWYPNGTCRQRVEAIERIARDLNVDEEQLQLTLTRAPDPTFFGLAHAWASGMPLERVLDDEDLSPGDFVRNVKQLVDLLRQIADATGNRDTRDAARDAATALFRGVVALSAELGGRPGVAGPDQDAPDAHGAPDGPDALPEQDPRGGASPDDRAERVGR